MTIPSLPRPDVPMYDPRTGMMSTAWYRYFQDVTKALKELAP